VVTVGAYIVALTIAALIMLRTRDVN